MEPKEKKMILILVIVSAIIIGGLLIWKNAINKGAEQPQGENNVEQSQGENETVTEKYVDLLEDGTRLNTSKKLQEIKKLDELEISGIQLTYQNGISVILANVTNTTNSDIGLTHVELTLYDDKNNELEKIDGLIEPVKVGESVKLNMIISGNYANAYDLKIVKK